MLALLNIFTCISSLSLIFYFIYLRITKKIFFITLSAANVNDYYYFFVYLLVIAIFWLILILILWLLKVRFSKNAKKKNYGFLLRLTFWYNNLNIFYKSYGILFDWLGPSYTTYIVRLAKKFLSWENKFRIKIIIVFSVLPRVIILIVLFYDIYSGVLYHYFYALWLLFIPLIFKFLVFMLKDVGPRLLPEFKKFLNFNTSLEHIHLTTADGIKKLKPIAISLKEEHKNDIDLDSFMNTFYYPMLYIEPEMAVNFLPIYTKISTVALIFYYIFHALTCIYILMFLS